MARCIYCLENKDLSDFDKEHVIPESFGSFENNFTLVNIVCHECNQYLGRSLELFLGRDTLEGMWRFIYGVKAPEDFKFLNRSRLLIKLDEEGMWKGAIMQLCYSEDQKKVVIDPVNQVGFKKQNIEQWGFFEVEDIKSKDDLEKQGYSIKGKRNLKILFRPGNRDKEAIIQRLKEKGIKITTDEEESLPFEYSGKSVQVQILSTIDKIIYRGVAKIAFNYLTYIFKKNLALDSNFNNIRNFIRYGEKDGFNCVLIQKAPILQNEKRLGIQETRGHLITLGWDGCKIGIVSQVTLFNSIIYRVILCKHFKGIYREIASGHHFDVNSKKISPLLHLPERFYIS